MPSASDKTKREKIYLRAYTDWNGHCAYCDQFMPKVKAHGPDLATVDHYVPKSLGGSLGPSNRVLCCKRCNQYKANRWAVEVFGKETVAWVSARLNEIGETAQPNIGRLKMLANPIFSHAQAMECKTPGGLPVRNPKPFVYPVEEVDGILVAKPLPDARRGVAALRADGYLPGQVQPENKRRWPGKLVYYWLRNVCRCYRRGYPAEVGRELFVAGLLWRLLALRVALMRAPWLVLLAVAQACLRGAEACCNWAGPHLKRIHEMPERQRAEKRLVESRQAYYRLANPKTERN